MSIKEACQKCVLTKKAIEYYIEQGLVYPKILANGYRDFSLTDIERLKQIAVLRKLDINIENIRHYIDCPSDELMKKLIDQKEAELDTAKQKLNLIRKITNGESWDDISAEVEKLELKKTVIQKLLNAFPGAYGKFISCHFSRFLNEPVTTEEQKEAFETIVGFLDNIGDIVIPSDLKEYLNESFQNMDMEAIRNMSESMENAVNDFDAFLTENNGKIEQFITYKSSEEYMNSLGFRLQGLLKKIFSTNGYYGVFIPAMRRLSPSYNEYCIKLNSANKTLISKYPQISSLK